MKNIKIFDTHNEYKQYISGGTALYPNVSYCKDTHDSHYFAEPSVEVTINVTSASNPTPVCYDAVNTIDKISSVIIDGEAQENVATAYTIGYTGNVTVKFIFKDGVYAIPESMFDNGASQANHTINIVSAKISNAITVIGPYAFAESYTLKSVKLGDNTTKLQTGGQFMYCSGLTSVAIPSSVRNLGTEGATFQECTNLQEIICLPKNQPSCGTNTFQNVKSNGTLYVPSGCAADYADSGNWNLQSQGWKIVELP